MKYAPEILGVMRPHPGCAYSMAQLVRAASGARNITPKQREAIRKGVRRVLEHLIENGQVERVGGGTRSMLYVWRGSGNEHLEEPEWLEQPAEQLR